MTGSMLLVLLAAGTLGGGGGESWDLRGDFSADAFPPGWRYLWAAPGSDALHELGRGPVEGCNGYPVERSWINTAAAGGGPYGSWLIVTVDDAPAWMAGHPETLRDDEIFVHPDQGSCLGNDAFTADVVIEWTAPRDGDIHLLGRARDGVPTAENCSDSEGRGVSWSFQHDLDTLWSEVTSYGQEFQLDTFLAVAAGDTLRFRCNARGHEGCDHGHLAVHIAYQVEFVRGDADLDGRIDIADAIRILRYAFVGGEPLSCLDAADADGQGAIDISDAVYLLDWLFLGSVAPPAPSPDRPLYDPERCGFAAGDSQLGCESFAPCR